MKQVDLVIGAVDAVTQCVAIDIVFHVDNVEELCNTRIRCRRIQSKARIRVGSLGCGEIEGHNTSGFLFGGGKTSLGAIAGMQAGFLGCRLRANELPVRSK